MNVSLDDDDQQHTRRSLHSTIYSDESSRHSITVSSDLSGRLINDDNRAGSTDAIEAGDRHGRLLLAALLENFCRLYEADPRRSERLFAVLCQTLSSMGILDQENVQELAGVRSHYSKAFKQLMLQAKQAVDSEDGRPPLNTQRSIQYFGGDLNLEDSSNEERSQDNADRNDIFSIASTGSRLSLAEWLGYEDTKYYSEFHEIGLLGKGGFGAVYHCRNKIDEREYAVKKIAMKRATTNHAKIYREIKTLARLEHPNIIRYFSSWLEHSRPAPRAKAKSWQRKERKSRIDESQDDMLFIMDDAPSFSSDKIKETDPEDSCGVVFEPSDGEDDEGHDSISAMSFDGSRLQPKSAHLRHDSRSSAGTASSARTSASMTYSIDPEASSMPSTSRIRSESLSASIEEVPRNASSLFSMSLPQHHTRFNRRRRKSESSVSLTLFIQMHLCPMTLRDHIRARNAACGSTQMSTKSSHIPDTRTYIDLFRAILEGARYVHRSGLCHRDIKPSNIFLAQVDESEPNAVYVLDPSAKVGCPSGIWVVPKLGDFGLVLPTSVEGAQEEESDEEEGGVSGGGGGGGGVGTAIYAAPEQSQSTAQMTSKCDVFALGIVFFEMLHPSTTLMERAKLLGDLRRGILPDGFVRCNPAESAVILAMTCASPGKRPTIEEILEMEIVVSRRETEKDRELVRVKHENEALRRRIMELERARFLD